MEEFRDKTQSRLRAYKVETDQVSEPEHRQGEMQVILRNSSEEFNTLVIIKYLAANTQHLVCATTFNTAESKTTDAAGAQ